MTLTQRRRGAVLWRLRYLQAIKTDDLARTARTPEGSAALDAITLEIETDAGALHPLRPAEIDALCQPLSR